jgi:hypothetical protein
MFAIVLIALVVIAAIGFTAQSARQGGLISHHSYNNRASDAAGAREDHLN